MKILKKIKLAPKYLTPLIIFLIPLNLAYHLILPSSYFSGILIDYLIPTVYLTDLLILLLLILKPPKIKTCLPAGRLTHPLIIFLLLIIPSALFCQGFTSSILGCRPGPSFYKFLQLTLLTLFSLHLSQNYPIKNRLQLLLSPLTYATLFQSLLALAQWFNQGSIFNYLPFGEQPYSDATPGIDKITWLDGSLKIPPLGTFPHPNILGGFLAITLPLIAYSILKGPTLRKRVGPYWITLILGLITLFLTFSLSAWLGFLLIGIPSLILSLTPKPNHFKHFVTYSGFFLILISFALKLTPLTTESSFTRRSTLTKISLEMFKDRPLNGVGLNHFTSSMTEYGEVVGNTRFLQPVHNIFLLILSESGLLGLIGFGYLIYHSLKQRFIHSSSQNAKLLMSSLLTLLFIGLFDHYSLTIHQGMLLLFTLL